MEFEISSFFVTFFHLCPKYDLTLSFLFLLSFFSFSVAFPPDVDDLSAVH